MLDLEDIDLDVLINARLEPGFLDEDATTEVDVSVRLRLNNGTDEILPSFDEALDTVVRVYGYEIECRANDGYTTIHAPDGRSLGVITSPHLGDS